MILHPSIGPVGTCSAKFNVVAVQMSQADTVACTFVSKGAYLFIISRLWALLTLISGLEVKAMLFSPFQCISCANIRCEMKASTSLSVCMHNTWYVLSVQIEVFRG